MLEKPKGKQERTIYKDTGKQERTIYKDTGKQERTIYKDTGSSFVLFLLAIVLFFFDLRILITSLVSSNSSYLL
jgi:uncharacterized protein (DUF608 family)